MVTPIRVFDRALGRVVDEPAIGLRSLAWLYANPLGRALRRSLLTRRIVSRLYGRYQESRLSRRGIGAFARQLDIDVSEAAEPIDAYPSMNAFFARRLRPGARPIVADPNRLASPADGRLTVVSIDHAGTALPVKGAPWSIAALLGPTVDASRFRGGIALVFRLAPCDYHRFHFPDSGVWTSWQDLPGTYESVHPLALAAGIDVFPRNHRQVSLLELRSFGPIAYVEVGALFVGAIHQTAQCGCAFDRGDEKGFFSFGGSTVILLFQPNALVVDRDLLTHREEGLETLVRLGEGIGTRPPAPTAATPQHHQEDAT